MAFTRPQPPIRVYVKVNSDFDSTGAMVPKSITWKDGRVFKIDSVRDFRPASTLGSGRSGDCFTVVIRGEEKHLFFQKTEECYGSRVGRWWVEVPAPVNHQRVSAPQRTAALDAAWRTNVAALNV